MDAGRVQPSTASQMTAGQEPFSGQMLACHSAVLAHAGVSAHSTSTVWHDQDPDVV